MFEQCGSIIVLGLLYDMGARTQSFFFFFFFHAERAYTPVNFGCALSSHAVSVNGARHNYEPAHRHKK